MAAAMEQRSFDSALASILEELDLGFSLKREQEEALRSFIFKKDVFAVLPTGYGKSFIYQLAPLVAKRMGLCENPMVLVVSPLLALMEDQVKEASNFGLTAMQLGVDSPANIRRGQCQLVFGSPEAWLLQNKWRDMLGTKVFQDNVLGVVVDEVHLIYKWGKRGKGEKAFRECFGKLGELRSLVKQGTPILALTATADLDSRATVRSKLQLEKATEVTVSPNRTNIRLGLKTIHSHRLDCFDWLVRDLKSLGPNMPHTIIYCRTLKAVGKVFGYLQAKLGEDCWVNRDPEHKVENLLVGIFHSQTLPHNKTRVLKSFSGEGACRVVVATTALGMGMNFPTVSYVIMYGVPEDAEAILQELGRAGRDGSSAHAVILRVKAQIIADEGVKQLLGKGSNSCFRKSLFANFEDYTDSVEPGHLCCTYCHSVCMCTSTGCTVTTPEFEKSHTLGQAPVRSREVTEDDEDLVRELLLEYKMSLVPHQPLFTSIAHCTGFGEVLINSVVDHCKHIFDLDYIMDNLPVFSKEHAQQILVVCHEVFEDFELPEIHMSPSEFEVPDQHFKGYFDDYSESSQSTPPCHSSTESGFSPLEKSDQDQCD